MTTSFERIREAAATIREHPVADQYELRVAAQHMDDWAAEVEAKAAVDGLAQRLRTVWATAYDTSRTPREWGQECEDVRLGKPSMDGRDAYFLEANLLVTGEGVIVNENDDYSPDDLRRIASDMLAAARLAEAAK